MALTDLSIVKSLLRSKTPEDDDLLNILISAASSSVISYLGSDPESKSHTEKFSGNLKSAYLPRNFPITSVTSVTIDGVGVPASSITFDDCQIILKDRVFTRGVQNVEITYVSGFATIPDDLKFAVAELVVLMFREPARLGERSKVTGPGSTVSFDLSAFSPRMIEVFSAYRRVWPA